MENVEAVVGVGSPALLEKAGNDGKDYPCCRGGISGEDRGGGSVAFLCPENAGGKSVPARNRCPRNGEEDV